MTPFSTETTRNSTLPAPRNGVGAVPERRPGGRALRSVAGEAGPASGGRAFHPAACLHRTRGLFARYEAERLEPHIGAVHLVFGVLRHGGDHQRPQRLVVLLAHGDLTHAGVG